MKKIFFATFCLLFSVVLPESVFAGTQKTAAEELTQLLNGFSTFQAHFSQVTTDVQNREFQKSSGNVMLMRPGRFRWETKNPTHQLVITDGKTLWVYDVDLKQATKQSVQNAPINPAKLLSGDASALVKQFTVHMIPHNHILVFQLVPKKPSPQFRSIAISFENYQLHTMQIQNSLEQTSTFHFSSVVLNNKLSPALFTFSAPPGVDVMQ